MTAFDSLVLVRQPAVAIQVKDRVQSLLQGTCPIWVVGAKEIKDNVELSSEILAAVRHGDALSHVKPCSGRQVGNQPAISCHVAQHKLSHNDHNECRSMIIGPALASFLVFI